MIVCERGHKNADTDDFCGTCGRYLWKEEPIVQPELSPPSVAQPTVAEPPRPTVIERVKQAIGIEPRAPSRAERVSAEAVAAPADSADSAVSPGGVAVAPSGPADAARPVAVPGRAPEQVVGWQPTAVKPGAPERSVPKPQLTGVERPRPGELICGSCGAGNDPTRLFCRKDGKVLVAAAKVPEAWWRRLIPRRRPLRAGERPQHLLPSVGALLGFALRALLGFAIVLPIASYTFWPEVRSAVNARLNELLKEFLPLYAPARPTADDTPAHDGHPASNAVDLSSSTFWAAKPGVEKPVLALTFTKPVDTKMIFTSGDTEDFLKNPRPKEVHLVFSDGSSRDFTLRDEPSRKRSTSTQGT